MSNSYDTQRPYAASYVIFRKGNLVAFVLRQNTSWMNNRHGLIAGKVEEGESFTEAAVREAGEEAGVSLAPEQLRQVLVMHRNSGDMTWVDVFFEVTEWEGEVINGEPHMHASLDWLDITALPDTIIPSLHAGLRAYMAGKQYLEYGWQDDEANE